MKRFAIVATMLLLIGLSHAMVTPVGPFVGEQQEGFQTQSSGACLGGRIFNNMADVCSSNMIRTSGWGFRCSISARTGGSFAGSSGGTAVITFDNPCYDFGGYFGTNSSTTPSSLTSELRFYDSSSTLVGTVDIDIQTCGAWVWAGGTSDVGIMSIQCDSGNFSGAFLDMDDLEASFTPTVAAPGASMSTLLVTIGLISAGILMLLGRKA